MRCLWRWLASVLTVSCLLVCPFVRVLQVKDFKRDAAGDIVWDSLSGFDRTEAREQFVRERFVAVEEAKLLRCGVGCWVLGSVRGCVVVARDAVMRSLLRRDKVKWCYRRSGVNHLELCKDEVSNYLAAISKPNCACAASHRLLRLVVLQRLTVGWLVLSVVGCWFCRLLVVGFVGGCSCATVGQLKGMSKHMY